MRRMRSRPSRRRGCTTCTTCMSSRFTTTRLRATRWRSAPWTICARTRWPSSATSKSRRRKSGSRSWNGPDGPRAGSSSWAPTATRACASGSSVRPRTPSSTQWRSRYCSSTNGVPEKVQQGLNPTQVRTGVPAEPLRLSTVSRALPKRERRTPPHIKRADTFTDEINNQRVPLRARAPPLLRVIIFRSLRSWVSPDPRNPIVQRLIRIMQPGLSSIRPQLPCRGMGLHLSLMISFLDSSFLRVLVVSSLGELMWRFGSVG